MDIFKKVSSFALILMALILGSYLKWEAGEIIVFAVFVWVIVNPLPSWLFLGIAIFSLALSPILNYLNKEALAEKSAVYAFFFLCLMLLMIIYEIRENKNIEV